MNILDINHFKGQHCETVCTGTLLNQVDVHLSEPMLFGLGEGLDFIFWRMKGMNFPFIGGRVKPDVLTKNLARNLNFKLNVKETTSKEKAWKRVKELIDQSQIVGLKLDSYHLEYFSNPVHFAGHYVALYGYDNEYAYLVDTQQQGGKVKTSLESLGRARSEKGPMSSKNLYYTISGSGSFDLQKSIRKAIVNNAKAYLKPAISNISYQGIAKMAKELEKYFEQSKDVQKDFKTTAMMMEKAGTGGALFRNFYRDFLEESYEMLEIKELKLAHNLFKEIAEHWTSISSLLNKAGETNDIKYIHQASNILRELSEKEKDAFTILQKL